MARAKKCDRCGKLHEHYDGEREFKNSEKANGVILIDRDLDNKYWTVLCSRGWVLGKCKLVCWLHFYSKMSNYPKRIEK